MAKFFCESKSFEDNLRAVCKSFSAPFKSSNFILANAILLPYVLVRNREAIADRLAAAGRYIGLGDSGFDGFLEWVLALRKGLNIPHTLAEINIPLDQAEAIGVMAKNDPSDGGNPVTLTPADYAEIYRNAVTGTL